MAQDQVAAAFYVLAYDQDVPSLDSLFAFGQPPYMSEPEAEKMAHARAHELGRAVVARAWTVVETRTVGRHV